MSTVDVKQYKGIVKFACKIKEKENIHLPLFFWGNHGIGKTTIIRDISNELDMNCVVLNLANQTPEELMGYPDQKGGYFSPDWLIKDVNKRTIYFLDEINRAPKYVLQSIFNFVNEGRINSHNINEHDIIIAAGNPGSIDYDVTQFDEKAFLSRFAHFYLEPSTSEVIKFLDKEGCNSIVLDLLKEKPDLCDYLVKDEDRVEVKPDNRMLHKAGLVLNVFEKSKKEFEAFGFEVLGAMVGSDTASIMVEKWKKKNEVPDIDDILTGKFPVKNIDINRVDVIMVLNGKFVEYFKKKKKKPFKNDSYKKNFTDYIKHIPKDSALGFVKDLKLKDFNENEIIDLFNDVEEAFLFDLLEVDVDNN